MPIGPSFGWAFTMFDGDLDVCVNHRDPPFLFSCAFVCALRILDAQWCSSRIRDADGQLVAIVLAAFARWKISCSVFSFFLLLFFWGVNRFLASLSFISCTAEKGVKTDWS